MITFEKHHFLLIDDSEIDSIITSKILQIAGLPKPHIKIRNAFTAIEYLKNDYKTALSESAPQSSLIILLDIHMPEINGFDFLELFEEMPEEVKDNSKIFLLTSSIDPTDIERANNNAYVVRVLNKPLNTSELLYYFEQY